MADHTYSVQAERLKDNKTRVCVRGFEFIIDEPEYAGGDNSGPTPVEYLLGSLTGCMNIVCNKVAKEMGLKINSLSFDFEGDINTDKFAGKDVTGRAGYYQIRAKIKADIDASEEEKLKWLKAVKERCPVSDNISNITPLQIILY